MSISFNAGTPFGDALKAWWDDLGRGERAELRRCEKDVDLAMASGFHHLLYRLQALDESNGLSCEQLAPVAALLADVRLNSAKSLPERMREKKGNTPLVSELRFRRLIQRERGELIDSLRRVLRQLKYETSIHQLANDVYFWGDTTRKRWAYAYFVGPIEKKNH